MYIGNCDVCGSKALLRRKKDSKKLVCRSCSDMKRYHTKLGWEPCEFCEKVARVAYRFESKPVCQNCYRNRFKPRENCEECNSISPLTFYKGNGKKICSTCLSRHRVADVSKHETCIVCKRSKPVCSRNYESKPICYSCYVAGHRGFEY